MTPRLLLPLLFGLLLAAGPVAAYDLRHYYSLKTSTVAGVAPGGHIVVKTRTGEKVRCTLVSRDDAGLVVSDREGETRELTWTEVRWVRGRSKAVGVDQARTLFNKDDIEDEDDDSGEDE